MELFESNDAVFTVTAPCRIEVKRLNSEAKLPTRGSEHSAGLDLRACITEDLVLDPGERVLVGTGIAVKLPDGTFGGIFARSGLAFKEGLALANGVGVVDSDYTGEVKVAIVNNSPVTRVITNGERIAQLVVIPYTPAQFTEVDELDKTERGDGGFGHTGKL